MLRIMTVSQSQEEVVLKVAGWLAGEHVDLLEQEGAHVLGQVRRLVLNLQEVRFIDEAGIALLQGWSSQGLVLRGGSVFIRALLKTHGLELVLGRSTGGRTRAQMRSAIRGQSDHLCHDPAGSRSRCPQMTPKLHHFLRYCARIARLYAILCNFMQSYVPRFSYHLR